MITILCDAECDANARSLADSIRRRYEAAPELEIKTIGAVFAGEPSWNDVLIVVFGSRPWSSVASRFIIDFRAAHPAEDPRTGSSVPGGMVLPVATDRLAMTPPPPISLLKAQHFDATDTSSESILRAVGTFLGLTLRRSQHKIFLSYATADGRAIAQGLFARLQDAGFDPWLDSEPEDLPVGQDVQQLLRGAIARAAMLVVVDTPAAARSAWIDDEIAQALGELIPVLPIVVGPNRDISRFYSLVSLQRRVALKPGGPDDRALDDTEWARVKAEIEQILLTSYQRRMRIHAHAEREFTRHGFQWRAVDARRRMFEARRKTSPRLPPKIVLSHCSIHDPTYVPALRVYGQYLRGFPDIASVHEKLCVLADVLSDTEQKAIWGELNDVPQFTIAGYNELSILIRSNFTQMS